MIRYSMINKEGLRYFILFFTIFLFYSIIQPNGQVSISEFVWLFLRVIISVFLLIEIFLKNKYKFSLVNTLYIFFLTFFILAPIVQYFKNIVFWSANKLDHDINYYFVADVLIILFLIFFYIGNKLKINLFNRVVIIKRKLIYPKLFYFTLTTIHILILIILIKKIGFPEMLFRFSNYVVDADLATDLIISKYIKALSIVIILYLFSEKTINANLRRIVILINILLFILIFFPTSAARFQIIGVYLGLFLFVFQKFFTKQSVNLLFLLGLFVVFPALEVFRNRTSLEELNLTDIGKSIGSVFNEGHYDAYQMFVNSIAFVNEFGITWGNQLLGVMFFFVPRSIWINKPIGSGAHIADGLNFSWTNVSMPLIGEGYINFGILGVVLFGLILGILCQYFDKKFWTKNINNDNGLFVYFYPVFIGYFFFMNRGDLMSSFAFIMGLFFAFYTINLIFRFLSNKSI